MYNSQKKWQKEFINKVFSQRTKDKGFSDIIILSDLDLLNSENGYLPKSLFKFYTATSENILDLKNKRIWVAHPSSFNDPYDCRVSRQKQII